MTDQKIESYVNFIKSRRLELPARLILESHLPLAGLMENMGHLAMPLLAPLLGSERMNRVLDLLRDRRSMEKLVSLL
jgi:hypothetical protein